MAWGFAVLLTVAVTIPLAPRVAEGGVRGLLAAHDWAVSLGYAGTLLVGGLAGFLLLSRMFPEPVAGHLTSWRRTTIALSAASFGLTVVGIALSTQYPVEKNGWCFGLDTLEVGGILIAAWNLPTLPQTTGGQLDNPPRDLRPGLTVAFTRRPAGPRNLRSLRYFPASRNSIGATWPRYCRQTAKLCRPSVG